jgi:hypothetical protein
MTAREALAKMDRIFEERASAVLLDMRERGATPGEVERTLVWMRVEYAAVRAQAAAFMRDAKAQ